jgi:uncharacterized membrane protein YfcA
MLNVFSSFEPAVLGFLAIVLLIAGAVRGFTGFGAGMIFMPIASSVMLPATAAAGFLFIDGIVALPLVIRAVRLCKWGTVLPAVIGAVISVHAGAWLLANTDVLVLRWIIFAIVTGLLVLLMSGWRYPGDPSRSVSFGVGVTAGILGGISQVTAPPVAAVWLSGSEEPAVIRANLIVFFPLTGAGTFVAYLMHGFFTLSVLHLLIVAVPTYAIGLFLGSRGFGRSSPAHYRKVAYALIGLAAVTSIPLLDPLLRQ